MLKDLFFVVAHRKKTKEFLFLAVGIIIFSIYAGVLIPANNLNAGGALGIAIVLNKATGLKLGTVQILMNIPLFYIGYKYIGKKFIVFTSIVIVVSSIFINNINYFITPVNIGDKLVASIFAGIMTGVGTACILIAGGSTGGSDITGKYIARRFNISLPTVFLVQDIIIYIFIWIYFDIRAVMYALILSFVRNTTMKGIERYFAAYLQATIVCDNTDEIVKAINEQLHRGSTIIDVEGGYSHKKHRMVILIIQQNEMHILRKIIQTTCPKAFITVNSVNTIMGNFKEHSYRL